MKMIRRVARLEHAMGVSDDPPPSHEIHVKYVAPDGSVVDGFVPEHLAARQSQKRFHPATPTIERCAK
jgi:hypothetical protein